jgi:hypothetical protein
VIGSVDFFVVEEGFSVGVEGLPVEFMRLSIAVDEKGGCAVGTGEMSLIAKTSSASDPESASDNLRLLGARSEVRIDPRPFDCSAASES